MTTLIDWCSVHSFHHLHECIFNKFSTDKYQIRTAFTLKMFFDEIISFMQSAHRQCDVANVNVAHSSYVR